MSVRSTVALAGASLVAPATVHTHSGSITAGGTLDKQCPATHAAGALDFATHHRWAGTLSSYGILVTQILGETDKYKSGHYGAIYVYGVYASARICDLKLRAGERVLFAAIPAQSIPHPLNLSGPSTGTAGKTFTLRVVAYNGKGVAKPVAGVHVSGASHPSNAHGPFTVTESYRGTAHFTAGGTGYIRSAPLAVKVG